MSFLDIQSQLLSVSTMSAPCNPFLLGKHNSHLHFDHCAHFVKFHRDEDVLEAKVCHALLKSTDDSADGKGTTWGKINVQWIMILHRND